MKIGIEVGETIRGRPAGIARYAAQVLRALRRLDTPHEIVPLYPWRRLPHVYRDLSSLGGRWYRRGHGVKGFDLVHATAGDTLGPTSAIEVATLHDLYQLTGPGMTPTPRALGEIDWYRRMDRVICVSPYARDDLHLMTDIPESRSLVIPLGVDEGYRPRSAEELERVRRRYDLPGEFLLFVGRPRENKNLERLIQGYAVSGVGVPLLLVGAFHKEHREDVRRIASACDVLERVRYVGFVKEGELPVVLTAATALMFPSTFEGFGIPALEAMACGTPVLTSRGIATEGVVGGHAVLIDPWSIEDIGAGIGRVIEVDDERLQAAEEYARRFTWEKTARRTLAVYEELLG